MFCFSGMQLVFKHLSRGGLSPAAILVFVFGFGWLLYVIHVAMLRTSISTSPTVMAFLLAAGALGYVGNFCAVRAMALAPHPGYARDSLLRRHLAPRAVGDRSAEFQKRGGIPAEDLGLHARGDIQAVEGIEHQRNRPDLVRIIAARQDPIFAGEIQCQAHG